MPTGPLGALSHDELGVVFDGLADPLQPVVAVALSSTCLGLLTPLQAALGVLQERHARAVALCDTMNRGAIPPGSGEPGAQSCATCAELRSARTIDWSLRALAPDSAATLGILLDMHSMPGLVELVMNETRCGDTAVRVLMDALGRGAAPVVEMVAFADGRIGMVGAEAIARAFSRGAMPKIKILDFFDNPIGDSGVAALAPPLRKLPALKELCLARCKIGDGGVASLLANLGKDDFKVLCHLDLGDNLLTDVGLVRLAESVRAGGMPSLQSVTVSSADASPAMAAVQDALDARREREP